MKPKKGRGRVEMEGVGVRNITQTRKPEQAKRMKTQDWVRTEPPVKLKKSQE